MSALSPRTQSMMGEGGGSPEELFEAAFQDLAMNQLITKNPEIAQEVATLKVLDMSPETNSATGSFIIARGDDEIHIPVVLNDNELMPFDTMYVKSLDMMMPLNPEYLQELDRMNTSTLGEAKKPSDYASSDLDIRNVVVPPTTGRYSYASAGLRLPSYLDRADNRIKQSFVRTLEKHPLMAKHAFAVYGVNTLKKALTPHPDVVKTASSTAEVTFITMETPVAETHAFFGDRSAEAQRDIASEGFAINDQRAEPAMMVSTERPLELEVPSSVGFYNVFFTDGKVRKALIFTRVLTADELRYDKNPRPGNDYGSLEQHNETCRMILTEDGEMVLSKKDFAAQHLDAQEVPDKLETYITKSQQGTPRNGQRGFFFNPNHKNMVAFEPIKIDLVKTKENDRYIYGETYSGNRVLLIQHKNSPISSPRLYTGKRGPHGRDNSEYVPHGFQTQAERKQSQPFGVETVVLIPENYRFVAAATVRSPNEVLKEPEAVMSMYYDALTLSGAPRIQMKAAGAGEYYCDGKWLNSKMAAVKYLIDTYDAESKGALEMVKKAEAGASPTYYVVPRRALETFKYRTSKLAQGPGMMAPPAGQPAPPPGPQGGPPPAGPQGGPPGGEQIDPQTGLPIDPQTGMPYDPQTGLLIDVQTGQMIDPATGQPVDPAMMQGGPMPAPAPPPPSPVEIAAAEIAEQLMMETDDIMQQMAMQQNNLQTQLGAIQAVAGRANQIAAEMGAPPPALPPELMMPPEGMPPEGMPPGAMPPGAMPPEGMPVEEPGMMETAMQLEDPELFDAAAMASLAKDNQFDDTISAQMPTLRDSLDAVGRMLTEVRMKGPQMREQVGDDAYTEIRDQLETLFSDLGNALQSLNGFVSPEM